MQKITFDHGWSAVNLPNWLLHLYLADLLVLLLLEVVVEVEVVE